MPEPTMRYICVFFAALGVLACDAQANDLCRLKGYNLEPLTKSYWAVQLDKDKCPNNAESCTLLFALCFSSDLCPKDAFACVVQRGTTSSLGGEAAISEKTDAEGFDLKFEHLDANATKIGETIIEFTCDSENALDADSQTQLVGWMRNPVISKLKLGNRVVLKNALACKKREGLGPGSQFMIIILVLFLIYFGGGIIYNHVNGARGEELIPNLSFWKNFPSYVVDGCIFVVRVITCQARENYSQNPDYGSTSQAGVSPSGRTYETL